MKKPVIGISTSVIVDHGGEFPGYERIYVNKDYISAVIAAGAVPLMIPMEDSEDNLQASFSPEDMISLHSVTEKSPMPSSMIFVLKEMPLTFYSTAWQRKKSFLFWEFAVAIS